MSFRKIAFLLAALFVLNASSSAQTPTPTPDDEEKVYTEEIKINVLAFDQSGKFASGVTKEDLVIAENGRLHQATSVRRIPANVLIVLDVGNEISGGTRRRKTSEAAVALVNSLQAEDSIAVMQYGDKVEFLSEWTRDKARLSKALDEKNLAIGRRSVFNQALDAAVKFFGQTPRENRHLILITNGVDSFNDQRVKNAALENLLSSDINVHVISYTKMQQKAIEPQKSVWQKGEPNPQRLPQEVIATMPLPQQLILNSPRLGSINTDREMIRKRKEEIAKLKTSEQFLTTLAEDTNGEIFLPEDFDEMVFKTETLATNIDSQYVATYTPKTPLSEAADGDVRNIEVTSRRTDIQIQGRRKFVVNK